MIIYSSLNDTPNFLYIMKNLFKCTYEFQTLTLAEQLVLQGLQMQEEIILVVLPVKGTPCFQEVPTIPYQQRAARAQGPL